MELRMEGWAYVSTQIKMRPLGDLNEEDDVVGHHNLIGIGHPLEGGVDFRLAERLTAELLTQMLAESSHGKRLSSRLTE